MAQTIKQGNIFGRIGSGIGQGLAEQLPKEIERSRLSSGLEELSNQKDLNPQQYLAKAVGIPGAMDRPALIQAFSDLARQQAFSKMYSDSQGSKEKPYIPNPEDFRSSAQPGEPQSITSQEGVQATIQPFIPPTYEKMVAEVRELMNKSPGLQFNDAMGAVQNKYQQQEKINQAQVAKRKQEQDVQSTAEQELKNEISTLTGGETGGIPGNVVSKIQDEALDAVRTGKMTEKEASKAYGKKALDIARQYADVDSLGNYTLITKSPTEVSSTLKALEKKFTARGDQKNFAQKLTGDVGISPPFAYSIAYPLQNTPKLHAEMNKLPSLEKSVGLFGGRGLRTAPAEVIKAKTLEASKNLGPLLEKGASPLSVYHALEQKGYDPEIWKNYLIDNQDELDLTSSQLDELTKSRGSFQGFLNDLWLKAFGG